MRGLRKTIANVILSVVACDYAIIVLKRELEQCHKVSFTIQAL